ncbi:hypothetical protein CEE39_06260 [bacterium (candidate division B38) B3_B38]|nr:MAG: hypothetical protein CEE39_06260 [bacterium (candidate division B38) B3_B38]
MPGNRAKGFGRPLWSWVWLPLLGTLLLSSPHPMERNQGWQGEAYSSTPQQLLTLGEAKTSFRGGWRFEVFQDSTLSVWAFLKPKLTTRKAFAFNKEAEVMVTNQRALSSGEELIPPIILYGKNFYPIEEMEGAMFFRWIEGRTANLIIINLNREVVTGDLTFQGLSFHRLKTLEIYYLHEELPELLKAFQVSPRQVERLVIKELELQPGVNILPIIIPQGAENIREITGKPDPRDVSIGLGEMRLLNIHKVMTERVTSPLKARELVPYQTSMEGRIKFLRAYFTREEREEEILPLLSIPLNKSYSLEEYPYLDAVLWVDNPDIGEIDIALEIEVEKLPSEKPITPQNKPTIKLLNIAYQSITEELRNLNLQELVEERIKYRFPLSSEENLYCRLKGIYLIAHKKWGTDCSGDDRGQYNFYFGNIGLYDQRQAIDVSFINLLESMEEKKAGIKVHPLKGDESLNFSLTEGEMDILLDFSSRREVGLSIAPFRVDCQREPFFGYEYWVERPEDSYLYCLLGIDTNNDGLPDKRVFPGLSFPLSGFLHTSTRADLQVDFYESLTPPMFPYNTEEGSKGKFLVVKDDNPIQLTWERWEARSESVSIGEADPRRIILTTRLNDPPQNHRYQLSFIPAEWETDDTRSGFRRVEVDLRDIIIPGPCRIVSLDFIFTKLWKIGIPITDLMKENFRRYRIRNIKFYHKSSGRVSDFLKDLSKARLTMLQLDEIPLILSLVDTAPFLSLPKDPASLSTRSGEPSLGRMDMESLKDGFWVNLGTHRLEKGSHRIRKYQNNLFDVMLLYLSSGADSQPFSIGEVKETPISPGGRLWAPGVGRVKLNFQRVNATKYKVNGKAARSFWLVFNESFDPGWRAYLSLKEKTSSMKGAPSQKPSSTSWKKKELRNHIMVNGYANGWYVDIPSLPSEGKQESEFSIILQFRPQLLFTIGLIISGLTLLACVAYLILYYRKRTVANKP